MNVSLHPIRHVQQQIAVEQAAAADSHTLLSPTHAVKKDGKIIGYVSILAMPIVHAWMDRESATVRDTLATQAQIEAIVRDRGVNQYYMPCQENSPYFPVLRKLGMTDLGGSAHLFHRKLED